jgi:predicted alpha/beta superfamily hydrolase
MELLKQLPLLFLIIVTLGGPSPCLGDDPIPVHETFKLDSKVLGETRTLTVWLPPAYQPEGADKYPIIYMPDGGVKEDFPHIANTIAKLVANHSIAPVILVGIENTQRRRDLTGPSNVESDKQIAPATDGANEFREFIESELFPEVGKRYRITEDRAILGESAAGLFIVETLFLRPKMFNRYIAMDPSLHWNDHELAKRAPERIPGLAGHEIKFWFASSDAIDIYPHTATLAEALKAHAPDNLKWTYLPQPSEHHSTIFRATKEKAFAASLAQPKRK